MSFQSLLSLLLPILCFIILETFIFSTKSLLLLSIMILLVHFIGVSYIIKRLFPLKNESESSRSLGTITDQSSIMSIITSFSSRFIQIMLTLGRSFGIFVVPQNESHQDDDLSFCDTKGDSRNELRTFAKQIAQNYITFWYDEISGDSNSFVIDCETALEQLFINLFELCATKLNSHFCVSQLVCLLEKHILSIEKHGINSAACFTQEQENLYLSQLIERLLKLCAPEEVKCVLMNVNNHLSIPQSLHLTCDNTKYFQTPKHLQSASLFLMIRQMLSECVFLPIATIITEPSWLFSNMIWICKQLSPHNSSSIINNINDKEISCLSLDHDNDDMKHTQIEVTHEARDEENAVSRGRNISQYRVIDDEQTTHVSQLTLHNRINSVSSSIASSLIDKKQHKVLSSSMPNISGQSFLNVINVNFKKRSQSCSQLINHRNENNSHNNFTHFDFEQDFQMGVEDHFAHETNVVIDGERPRTSTKMFLSSANKTTAIENAMEADEIDLQLFINVGIPTTEDSIGSSGHFTLYCIQYDALFEEINSTTESNALDYECIEPYLVRRQMKVKRRFREFVTLQMRLEENRHLRKHMKGFKKPSSLKLTGRSLFHLPSPSKLSSNTIEFRRKFLEEFLNQLCDCPYISKSIELQQFLAYGLDARIAFVKNKSQTTLPLKLDKVIYGMKGALKMIRTAIPVESSQIGRMDSLCHFIGEKANESERLNIKEIPCLIGEGFKMQMDKKLNEWIDKYGDNEGYSFNHLILEDPASFMSDKTLQLNEWQLGDRSSGDGCESDKEQVTDSIMGQDFNCSSKDRISDGLKLNENFLSFRLINICSILMFTNEISSWKSAIINCVKLFFGKIINDFILHHINLWLTRRKFVFYLHLLHESLWPSQSPTLISSPNCDHEESESLILHECQESLLKLFQSLISKNIPQSISSKIIDDNSLSHTFVSNCLKVFNSHSNNKLFVYQYIEMILTEIEKD